MKGVTVLSVKYSTLVPPWPFIEESSNRFTGKPEDRKPLFTQRPETHSTLSPGLKDFGICDNR